ncbi:MAG: DUF2059 domain-containing protein [Bacteroidota bacterium]
MKNSILALLFSFFLFSAVAQTSAKTEKIKTLLEVTGSANLGVQIAKQMIDVFKGSYSNVDQKFWDEFTKEIKAEDLVNLILPIYEKYYTEEDLDQIIAFYKTPIGKKMVETLPMISQESMTAGQTWGRELGEKVVMRLKEKGYIKE